MNIRIILLLPLFLLPLVGKGEVKFRGSNIDTLSHTFSQKKVNIDGFGFSYQQEINVSQKNTIVLSGGLSSAFIFTSGRINSKFGYTINPFLTIGSRHYYRIKPAALKKKQNIGNFVGVSLSYETAPIVHKGLYHQSGIYCTPQWGIQRSFAKNGSFELGLGLSLGYGVEKENLGSFSLSPAIQLRFGWLIRKKYE